MSQDTAVIVIQNGREKPIINKHPWIFSGAIAKTRGNPTPGDIVTVESHSGQFLGRGYWNPKSQIQVRLLTWQNEPIDAGWWERMIARAIGARQAARVGSPTSSAPMLDMRRLINAESDFLPGLIVDQYGEWLVIQALTLGIDQRKQEIVQILVSLLKPRGIYERSDVDVRGKEGLRAETGVLWGEEPPPLIWTNEIGLALAVDVRRGHKTGHYLDQAINRALFFDGIFKEEARILNLFSYTGSFGLFGAAAANSRSINVDSSFDSLELAEQIFIHNHVGEHGEFIQADIFEFIRDQVEEGERYDVIICDPPKFAHNAGQVDKAARGYKDLNLHSFKLVQPGGYLMTFSCSGAITRDLFQKIVFGALADSGREAQIVRHLSAGDDHPVALTFPEGEYLKGLLLRVY